LVAVTGVDVYRAAFVARCEAVREPGQSKVDAPGICGLLASPGHVHARLLITEDRARDLLAAMLPDAKAGMITVFAAAPRCRALVAEQTTWTFDEPTAMICRDLRDVPAPALPAELTLRPVRRSAGDRPEGVPLEDAVAAVLRANPTMDDPAKTFAVYLRSLPSSARLLCAVDREGVVRATSASSTFGAEARVFFVNTDPGWRRRGIGLAMTAAALLAARQSGAHRASLDASDAGRSIYSRLGFEAISQTVRFFRARA
jgi:ribosomal protein S18 acetylase RimI-like enzyme